ncbi:MAG: hypothetical protein K2H13_07345, partial [Eubacterium sp.]|nr:hypothetical protein [Eubacterium sp.]
MKKLLSVFLSLLMLLSITAGIDFSAYAQNNSFEIYETNPIYSFFGISSSEQSSQRKVFARAAETDKSDVLYSVEEAADYVREHMISREGEIIVRLQSTEDDFSLLVKSIFEAAISNDLSKCSLDGDYLKYNWSNYGASGLYYIYPDYYLYEITFNIAYNTTAAQELAVQNEVEKIIRDNKLEGKSDYAKIKSIHN